MIVIAGTVRIRPEGRSQATQAAVEMATATRKEPGCISYRFSADLEDPNVITIFEEWESDEALKQHFESDHMRVFRQRLPAVLAGAPAMKRYVVESVAPM